MENNKQPLNEDINKSQTELDNLAKPIIERFIGSDEWFKSPRNRLIRSLVEHHLENMFNQGYNKCLSIADEQTKPLKEEIGMLKLDLGLADIEIKNTKRTLGQCESALLERESSLSLAKKENEELAQQLSDKELEYVNEVGKTYNLIDVIKLSKAELTSVKGHLTENKNNLLSVCEYFSSMENAELNHKQLETFLINLGGKLNESLNNYKK